MGSDHSHLTGVEIEEKAVQVSDFWSHHCATVANSGENVTNLTVLIGDMFVEGPLWKARTPLETASKNLMIYRHPCIVRYISSWQKNSKFHLAVEQVTPLSQVLASQSGLQMCIGLHSILKALCFLHDKAQVSHNNVCTAAVYVTKDGNWKLGGMEYLCRFGDLTCDYLKRSKASRYNKAVDSNEEKLLESCKRRDFIDCYAFGTFVDEVLKAKTDEEIPSLTVFRELCKTELQGVSTESRPKLEALLEHDFFNHEFIIIHSFLVELPLKSDEERVQFFQTLAERLSSFPEETVASQLGNLLLSRMVLLNRTAQVELLPFVLCPRSDPHDGTKKLFSADTCRRYLAPKLLEIFCVRDAQIRLLILTHFKHFIDIFTKDDLQSCILPELLVGVKDTNDHLVSVTLRALADLVPVLGAATVIGGKRAKLFNDGRPNSSSASSSNHARRRNSARRQEVAQVPVAAPVQAAPLELPERPRPDGEEGETSTEEVEASVEEDLDNWEDWDLNATNNDPNVSGDPTSDVVRNAVAPEAEAAPPDPPLPVLSSDDAVSARKPPLPDITELDIKNQRSAVEQQNRDEIDFFQDMEPVIEAASKFVVPETDVISGGVLGGVNSKLSLKVSEAEQAEDGWGEGEWE